MKKLILFLVVALMVVLPIFTQAKPAAAFGCYDITLDAFNRGTSPAELRRDAKFANDWLAQQGIPTVASWGQPPLAWGYQTIQIWNPANDRIGYPGGELIQVIAPKAPASIGGQVCYTAAANTIENGPAGRWMNTGMAPAEKLPVSNDTRVPQGLGGSLGLLASQIK